MKQETQRTAAFKAHMRGIDASIVAYVLNRHTPGIDHRGCSKDLMARNFGDPDYHQSRVYNRIDLPGLRAEAEAEMLRRARARFDAHHDLLSWLVREVLTDGQLDLVPPGQKYSVRQLLGRGQP